MNMPALPVISPSQPPNESPARIADDPASSTPPAFSKVLSQQQGRPATGQPSADATTHAVGGQPRDGKARDPLDPDSTLNLILDSAALPLMQAQVQTPANALPAAAAVQTVEVSAAASVAQADARALATPTAAALLTSLAPAAQKPSGTAVQAPAAGRQAQAGAVPAANIESLLTPATELPASEGAATGGDHGSLPSPAQTTAASPARRTGAGIDPRVAGLQISPATIPLDQNTSVTASTPNTSDAQAALFGAPATAVGLPPSPATQAAAPIITLAVATPLASTQWAQDLSRQLVTLAQSGPNGTHTVQLHVNPPELGPIHITLQIGDSMTQAAFVSPHAHVRQTLENALPRLEQQFAQAGLSLGQANVSDQQAGQQGFAQPFAAPRNASGAPFNPAAEPTGATPPTIHMPNPARHPDTLVDTFA